MGREIKTEVHEMYKKSKFVGGKRRDEARQGRLRNNKMHGSVFSGLHWSVNQ
jgi:hypothetical protein